VLAVVLVLGKTLGVTIAAFLTGNGLRRAIQAGLSLSQIGEFAFIVIAVGVQAHVVRSELLPIVVGASCLTAISGSWQIRASGRFASWVDARLPKPIATFVTFYESWIARLRSSPTTHTFWRKLRRPLTMLVIDAALVLAVVIGTAVAWRPIVDGLVEYGIDGRLAMAGVFGVAAISAGLFLVAIARGAVRLALLLASQIIPAAEPPPGSAGAAGSVAPGRPALDLGRAPRRALVLVLELAIVLVIGLPLAALTQPFVPGGGLVVLAAIVVLSFAARRSITDFDSHVRAGTALIVEVLARQSTEIPHAPSQPGAQLAEVEALLPGFGGITPVALPIGAPAVGRNLAELDLRAKTGASVLAITRDGGGIATPSPREPLRAGDVLALAGSEQAIAAARALLLEAPREPLAE
jgi:CPA2 family monovalent cation:H+ antiporter-2